jgi:hypothetical protein
MPIKIPDLDNRTYEDLMQEMIASIPKYTKEWTNFNPSDPGIAILELLAWITETFIFRTNIIPEQSYINFLKLVAGTEIYDQDDADHKKIRDFIHDITTGEKQRDLLSMKAIAEEFITSRYTAVTEEDYKHLILKTFPDVKRVEVFPFPFLIQIIVIPETISTVILDIESFLYKRRLIGTAINVTNAEYLDISLGLTLLCKSYANSDHFGESITYHPGSVDETGKKLEDLVAKNVFMYFDSLTGGPEGTGWPIGRNVMKYELFQAIELEEVEGLVSVDDIKIFTPAGVEFPIKVKGLIRFSSLILTIKEEN